MPFSKLCYSSDSGRQNLALLGEARRLHQGRADPTSLPNKVPHCRQQYERTHLQTVFPPHERKRRTAPLNQSPLNWHMQQLTAGSKESRKLDLALQLEKKWQQTRRERSTSVRVRACARAASAGYWIRSLWKESSVNLLSICIPPSCSSLSSSPLITSVNLSPLNPSCSASSLFFSPPTRLSEASQTLSFPFHTRWFFICRGRRRLFSVFPCRSPATRSLPGIFFFFLLLCGQPSGKRQIVSQSYLLVLISLHTLKAQCVWRVPLNVSLLCGWFYLDNSSRKNDATLVEKLQDKDWHWPWRSTLSCH